MWFRCKPGACINMSVTGTGEFQKTSGDRPQEWQGPSVFLKWDFNLSRSNMSWLQPNPSLMIQDLGMAHKFLLQKPGRQNKWHKMEHRLNLYNLGISLEVCFVLFLTKSLIWVYCLVMWLLFIKDGHHQNNLAMWGLNELGSGWL